MCRALPYTGIVGEERCLRNSEKKRPRNTTKDNLNMEKRQLNREIKTKIIYLTGMSALKIAGKSRKAVYLCGFPLSKMRKALLDVEPVDCRRVDRP